MIVFKMIDVKKSILAASAQSLAATNSASAELTEVVT